MPNIVTIMIRHEERKRERELRLARERERGEEYGRKEGRKMARRKGVLRVCKMRVERNGWVSGGTRACMQKFWFSAGLLASSFFFFFFPHRVLDPGQPPDPLSFLHLLRLEFAIQRALVPARVRGPILSRSRAMHASHNE